MTSFNFNATTLLSVLKASFYRVPIYQRSYSWGQQQVEDFWTDISRAISDNSQYFLGTLVFSSGEDAELVSVIDGQQRIATTTLLLAAMRKKLKDQGLLELAAVYSETLSPLDPEDGTQKPRIRLNADDHPLYETYVLLGNAYDPQTESQRRIVSAFTIFEQRLESLIIAHPAGWQTEFQAIYKFLNKQARVVTVTAPTEADSFTIFETLNDRGIDLTISDLLKNYLFSQAGDDLEIVQSRWVAAQTVLSEYQEEGAFVIFLRHLWSSFYGATRERDLFRAMKDKVRGRTEALAFSKRILDGARTYGALLSSENEFWSSYGKGPKDHLKSLIDFNLQQSRPTLMALFDKFTKLEIEKSLKSFVAFSVRGLVVGGIGGGQAERYLCEAAVEIRSGTINSASSLLTKLKPITPSNADFIRAFSTMSTGNNRFARYLLRAIENQLLNSAEPELVPNEDAEKVNLEHILPRNATKSDWPAFTDDERKSYSLRLGNMTLLQKGTNGKIGNKPWTVKQPVIALSQLELNKKIASLGAWRTGEIETRQLALAQIAPTVWPV